MLRRRTRTDPTPEESLRRYRETGDPAALGALFDTLAPGLFRVALGIAPDAATAEEAVQDTFLKVIDAAKSCDPSRPVMPWLVTILKNRLIDVKRRLARVPDPLKLTPKLAERDPATDAERSEMIETVREEIERLDEPYRSVALLRWRYGLTPGEIAHVRGEPPGTVRSSLSRALDRLRKVLKSVTPILIVLGVRPRTGLAAVRKAVMAQATAGVAAVSAAGILVGGTLVNYTTAALVLLTTFTAGAFASLGIGVLVDDDAAAGIGPDRGGEGSTMRREATVAAPPLAVVQHWVTPPRSEASLGSRIEELLDRLNGEWHNSFTVGNLLTAFDEETVVRVLTERWTSIASFRDRQQILKAFAFRRHARTPDILHLGMNDPEPAVKLSAAYHLIGIAGRDFRMDLGAYSEWWESTRGRRLPEVLERTSEDLAARLRSADREEVLALSGVLLQHSWKVRNLASGATRLLSALEPWLETAGPALLRDLLSAADNVDASEGYFRRTVMPRIEAEPEIRPAVFAFLGDDENRWATDDLLRRVRDPYEPALRDAAVALGAMKDFRVVPDLIEALRFAPTREVREAIEAGLEALTEFETDDWEAWWILNREHLGKTERR